ncbi:MAG: DUF3592 domain-containing protein [Nitrospirota bacterium]|nr:DUF3592 domain-containing protein [Nitrospirota bacterium]
MEYVIAIFGVLFILGGLYHISNARQTIKEAAMAKSWPRVPCEIIKSEVVETYGEGTTFYHAEIEYEYHVKGASYSNDAISMGGDERTSNREYMAALCKKYPLNSMKKVVYNPNDPEESYLDLSTSTPKGSIVGGIIFIIAGMFILGIFYLVRLGVITPVV